MQFLYLFYSSYYVVCFPYKVMRADLSGTEYHEALGD